MSFRLFIFSHSFAQKHLRLWQLWFDVEIGRITTLNLQGIVYRTDVKVQTNDIAICRRAHRTFIGNIYKLVKDPNLVSALTGHVEGSRAFTRYRTIDIDMKKDLVKILEGKQ